MRRFSIRQLLLAVSIAAAVIALGASIRNGIIRERTAADRIIEFRGEVTRESVGVLSGLLGDRVTGVRIHTLIPPESGSQDYNPVDDLKWLPQLRSLRISASLADDDDLAGLKQVSTGLRELYVSSSAVSGQILSLANRFTRLETISLRYIDISRSNLIDLLPLSRLESLELSSCPLTDPDLAIIGKLTSLRTLTLSSKNIQGETLKSLENLTQLEMLQISTPAPLDAHAKEMVAAFESIIGKSAKKEARQSESGSSTQPLRFDQLPILPAMRTLSVGGCTFDSQALAIIDRQPKLAELNLSYGKFPADLSTTDIGNWKIKTLRLTHCEDILELIREVSKIETLESISIYDPRVGFGDLQPLARLPRLRTLVLSAVKNDGQVGVFREFPAITALHLWGHQLSGEDRRALPPLKHMNVYDFLPPPWL